VAQVAGRSQIFFIYNGRYIDYLSLTYATDKSSILKVTYRYYIRQEEKTLKTFKISIEILIIRSSQRNSNREGKKSVLHHFCPGLPVSLTLCPTR